MQLTEKEMIMLDLMQRAKKLNVFRNHSHLRGERARTLGTIDACGEEGITVCALAERLNVPSSGVSRMIKLLESEGYVERMHQQNDRRNVVITLTELGKNEAHGIKNEIHDFWHEVFCQYSDEEFDRMIEDLSCLFDRMEKVYDQKNGSGETE